MTDVLQSDGMTPTKTVFDRDVHKCLRCPHVWMSRKGEEPKRCPSCKSSLWNSAKKQQRGPKPGTKQKTSRKDATRGRKPRRKGR